MTAVAVRLPPTHERTLLFTALMFLALAAPARGAPLFRAPSLVFDTGGAPASVAVADLDGDGHPDVVAANSASGTVSVLLGIGDGTFRARTDYGVGNSPHSVAIADLNHDGRPDVVTANYGSSTVSVLLGNGDGTLGTKMDFATEQGSGSLAIADVNMDGRPDLVTGNSALLGNGDGTFGARIDVQAGNSAIAIGDLNGDGRPDLVATNGGADPSAEWPGSSAVSVLLGNGDGTFGTATPFGIGNQAWGITVGDVNGDGRLDVAVTQGESLSQTVSVLFGNGDGTLGVQRDFTAAYVPAAVAIADLNGDGRADLVTANTRVDFDRNLVSHSASVMLGNGDGTFRAAIQLDTGQDPLSVAIADLDGDGHPDLVTANQSSNTISVFLGNGDGTFGSTGIAMHAWSVAVDDFNGDGKPDLAALGGPSGSAPVVSVLLGDGDGSFQIKANLEPGNSTVRVAAADLDGDGHPDVVTANSWSGTVSVLLGIGDGTFRGRTEFTTGGDATSVAIADLNEDGHPDLAVTCYYSGVVALLLGNGDGTFRAIAGITTGPVTYLATADLNGDGHQDLVLSDGSLRLGHGDGTFGDKINLGHGGAPAVGDLNGDGIPDLAMGGGWVLLGNGGGTFRTSSQFDPGYDPTAVVIRDFNADGRPDLAVLHGELTGTISLLPGNGDGTFGSRIRFGVGKEPGSMVIADFNRDGRPDLATASSASNSVSILFGNASIGQIGVRPGRPASLAVALEGFRPNPASGAPTVAFTLASASPAAIEVFDLAGRRVLRRDVGGLGAGPHVITLGTGAVLTPGMYLVRLHQVGRTVSARGVVVR